MENPDFSTPRHALEEGWRAILAGKTHYAPTNGIPELREGLAQKAYKEYGLGYDPNSEIMVTVGGIEAISLALIGLINPGDEVLIPNPGFVCYEPTVRLAGGTPISIPILEKNEFKPSIDDVMSLITKKITCDDPELPKQPYWDGHFI